MNFVCFFRFSFVCFFFSDSYECILRSLELLVPFLASCVRLLFMSSRRKMTLYKRNHFHTQVFVKYFFSFSFSGVDVGRIPDHVGRVGTQSVCHFLVIFYEEAMSMLFSVPPPPLSPRAPYLHAEPCTVVGFNLTDLQLLARLRGRHAVVRAVESVRFDHCNIKKQKVEVSRT